jgi:hypothetical protein
MPALEDLQYVADFEMERNWIPDSFKIRIGSSMMNRANNMPTHDDGR